MSSNVPRRPRRRLVLAAALRALLVLLVPVLHAGSASAVSHKEAYKQGIRAIERGEYDWAVVYLQRAVDLKPENVDYRARLGQAKQRASFQHFETAKKHLASGNLEEAIAELQQTVALNPAHQYAYVELEKALAEWKRVEELRVAGAAEMERRKREADALQTVPKLDPASNVPIQFQLENKSLKEIFKVIGEVSNINVIFDEGVQLDKTASLVTDNVTLEEALDLLMLQQGLAFKVLNRKTILVYQNNQTKQREYEDQVIRTFYLSNADAKEVNAILRSVIDLRKTAVNEELNAITILDSQDKIAIAGRLIEGNDKAKAELIIDLEILEVNRAKLRQLGIDIRTGESPGITSTIAFDDDEVRLNNLRRLTQLGSYILGPIPTATIQLLRTDGDTKTLSRPQVRVTDREKVTLHLGDQVPIPNTTFNTSNTVGSNVVPVTSYTYQNVGIQVQLEPQIHHNREITLKMQAEISSVASTNQSGQPTIGTREVDTVIRLRDGETNLLAGLFQEQDGNTLSGVPGLTDIPGLRRIFGSTRNASTETEIILTVTPHIVRVPDIGVPDLAPMQVGTERDRRLRGESHYGVGGSPFRNPDDRPQEDLFTSLRPGSQDAGAERLVVPDAGLASGSVDAPARDPIVISNETIDRALAEEPAPEPAEAAPSAPAPRAPAPPPPSGSAPPPSGGGASAPAPATSSGSGAAAEPVAPPAGGRASGTTGSSSGGGSGATTGSTTGTSGGSPSGGAPATPTGPVRLFIVPSQPEMRVGERVTLEVRIDAAGNEVANVPWHLRFDPALVRLGPATEGGFFRQAGANSLFLPELQPGRLIVGHSQFGGSESVTGAGTLAVIPLEALAAGEVRFTFENASVTDRGNDRVPFRTEELIVRIRR